MAITDKNKGTPESRKRKLSDTDLQSPEEENTSVATEKTLDKKKKNKQKKKQAPSKKNKTVHEEPHIEDEDNSDDNEEANNSANSTQQLKETSKSKSGSTPGASKDVDRTDDRDRRTLFLKDLPANCTVRHVKALSKDIKQVRVRTTFAMIDNKRKRIAFAYVAFSNEEAAEKNFKILEGTVMKGTPITVDYVGSKSKFQTARNKKEPGDIDPLRLYVSGLPGNATEDDMLKLFPGAIEVVLPKRNKDKLLFGYGFVGFDNAELTSKYHDQSQDLTLSGRKLVVLYAKKRKSDSGKSSEKPKKKQKGAKVAAKEEVDMDQDDESDEDDDVDDGDDDDEDDSDDDE